MGLASIAGDLVGGLKNAAEIFMSPSMPYPTNSSLEHVYNTVTGGLKERSWKRSKGYAFRVVRVKEGVALPAFDWVDGQMGRAPGEFRLQINPQELSQDEIFAINVTPTFSGVIVEHQGVTLKDIMISGTTGLSPMRRGGGAFPQTGAPVFAAGHSGYREFHMLRNFLRVYVEKKRIDPGLIKQTMGELRLVWRNLRDHEDLYVEPQKFTMRRSSTKPHLYDYQIQLKAIGKATIMPLGGWLDLLELTDEIIDEVQMALDACAKMIEGFIDYAERVSRDIRNTILGPVRAYARALRAIRVGQERLTAISAQYKNLKNDINKTLNAGKTLGGNLEELTKKNLEQTRSEIEAVKAALRAQALNAAFPAEYAKALAATPTMGSGAGSKTEENKAYAQKVFVAEKQAMTGLTPDELAQVQAELATLYTYEVAKLNKALSIGTASIDKMLAQNTLFETQSKLEDVKNFYNQTSANAKAAAAASANLQKKKELESSIALAKAIGDKAGLASAEQQMKDLITEEEKLYGVAATKTIASMSKAATKTLQSGETIQTLATKYLNDPDAYKSLVILNGLVPPYVSSTVPDDPNDKVPGVLYPGDKFLVPQQGGGTTNMNVTQSGVKAAITAGLNPIEKSFGVDLQLDDDGDFVISNTGDIKMIAGTPNVSQGIALKLMLEPGSLKRHLEIGADLGVGVRTLGDGDDATDELLNRVRRSIEADSRIDSVIYAGLEREGSSFILNLILRLRQVDQPVSLPLRIA